MKNQNTNTMDNTKLVLTQFIENLQKSGKTPTRITIIDGTAFIEVGMNFTKIKKGYIFDMQCAQIAEGKWESDGTIHQTIDSNCFNGSYKAELNRLDREDRLEAKFAKQNADEPIFYDLSYLK